MSTRSEDAADLPQDVRGIVEERQEALAEHCVERVSGEGKCRCLAYHPADRLIPAAGFLYEGRGAVEADDVQLVAAGEKRRAGADSATKIQNAIAASKSAGLNEHLRESQTAGTELGPCRLPKGCLLV
jgi:hypothetical protein